MKFLQYLQEQQNLMFFSCTFRTKNRHVSRPPAAAALAPRPADSSM
jgi:hypothetical protein